MNALKECTTVQVPVYSVRYLNVWKLDNINIYFFVVFPLILWFMCISLIFWKLMKSCRWTLETQANCINLAPIQRDSFNKTNKQKNNRLPVNTYNMLTYKYWELTGSCSIPKTHTSPKISTLQLTQSVSPPEVDTRTRSFTVYHHFKPQQDT